MAEVSVNKFLANNWSVVVVVLGAIFTAGSIFSEFTALKSELSDPRFADGYWQEQINTMLKLGKKAEQQSLAKYGLDFVTDTYLPEKLAELGLA